MTFWQRLKSIFTRRIPAPVTADKPPLDQPTKPEPVSAQPISTMTLGYEFMTQQSRYAGAQIRKEHVTRSREMAMRIIRNMDRYIGVMAMTEVPWFVIGCIHAMESGCDFAGVLHNGEKIIGTGRKTRLVPAGRGPFTTWESAAVDAILSQWRPKKWTLGDCLEFMERWNGLGYRKRGVNSPYLWSMTTAYTAGRYVADGKFDPKSVSKQVGAAAIMKSLEALGVLRVSL